MTRLVAGLVATAVSAGGVLAVASTAEDRHAGASAACPPKIARAAGHAFTVYWLGDPFRDLPVTYCDVRPANRPTPGGNSIALSLIYGDCTPEPGTDGGCAPPLNVQETSVCAIDPLTYDILPLSRSVSRGALVARYDNDFTDVYTGTTNVRITNDPDVAMRSKIAALRPVGRALRRARLPMPRFPRSTMRTLRRVRALYRELGSTRRVRSRLRISRTAVRDRLDLLRDIERLARSRGARVRTVDC